MERPRCHAWTRATWAAIALAYVTCLPARAPADDERASKPTPVEAAASAVTTALRDGDEAVVARVARAESPDPWLVAIELARGGVLEDARALAAHVREAERAALSRVLDTWEDAPPDPDVLSALDTAEAAAAAGRWSEANEALGRLPERAEGTPDMVDVRRGLLEGARLRAAGRGAESAAAYAGAARVAESLGWLQGAAVGWNECARSALAISDDSGAAEALDRQMAAEEARGSEAGIARAQTSLAVVRQAQGANEEALRLLRSALETQTRIGDAAGRAKSLGTLGVALWSSGALREAQAALEEALDLAVAQGDESWEAACLGNLALVHQSAGTLAAAEPLQERSLALKERRGDDLGVAITLQNLGVLRSQMGDSARALDALERALALSRSLGDSSGVAYALTNLATVLLGVGDVDTARDHLDEALEIRERLGEQGRILVTRAVLSDALLAAGRVEEALRLREETLAGQRQRGDWRAAAISLGALGRMHARSGDVDGALERYERAFEIRRSIGDSIGAGRSLLDMAMIHYERDAYDAAESAGTAALDAAEASLDRNFLATALWVNSGIRLMQGRAEEALALARHGVETLSPIVRSHAEEHGSALSSWYAGLFRVGAQAALASGRAEEATAFLESGRAAALVAGMGGGDAVTARLLPKERLDDLTRLRIAEAEAMHSVLVTRASDADLPARQAARDALTAAQTALRTLAARIEREMQEAASVVTAGLPSVRAIQSALETSERLTLYSLWPGMPALAAVIDRDEVRLVTLAASDEIETAVEALSAAPGGEESERAARHLRALVVDPLSLPPDTRRWIVAPDGALAFAAYALLVPDVEVSLVPSARVLELLRARDVQAAHGVLALGDPDYTVVGPAPGGGLRRSSFARLVSLPATREEARAVGTRTLLGREATEQGLEQALRGQARWRSVHLACHGVIDPVHPERSGLALVPDAAHDGMLTPLDLLTLQVPADLVVLSGCETARGRMLRGEGVLGLARAFLHAGATRVICSQWKVPDEATRALMERFYELWAPRDDRAPLSAAAALRAAQAFVRTQPGWNAPRYWAAWVLWGLPD